MFRSKAQRTRSFLFGHAALHHQVVGYLEVANTMRYKGPSIIAFAIMDERLSPESEFLINPQNMQELFEAARQNKYRPVALLSNMPRALGTLERNYTAFPQSKDGFPLAKRPLVPSRNTPTFGMVTRTAMCLAEKPSEIAVFLRAKAPAQMTSQADPRVSGEINVALMIDPTAAAGMFCITPSTVERVFALCAAYSIEPLEFRSFVKATGSFEMDLCNRFIDAHQEGSINGGEPIYSPGFDINETYKNRTITTEVQDVEVEAVLDQPTALRQGASITTIGTAAAMPPVRNRRDIQARQAL